MMFVDRYLLIILLVVLPLARSVHAIELRQNGYTFTAIGDGWIETKDSGKDIIELQRKYKKDDASISSILLDESLPDSYWYRFKVSVNSGSHFHTLFNAGLPDDGSESFYQLSIRFSSDNVVLKKKWRDQKLITLVEGPRIEATKRRWHDLMVVKQNSRILVYVDDMRVPKIDTSDPLPEIKGGRIGIGYKKQYKMRIKDFEFHPEPMPLLNVDMEFPQTTSIRLGEELKVHFRPLDVPDGMLLNVAGSIKPYGGYKPIEYKWDEKAKLDTHGKFVWEYIPKKEGVYEATFFIGYAEQAITKRVYFTVVDTAIGNNKEAGGGTLRLVSETILNDTVSNEWFRHNRKGRIRQKQDHAYWESGVDRHDYLALKLRTRNKHLPHLIKIDYPDDADRSQSFTLTYRKGKQVDIGGVHTGFDIPVTGKLSEYSAVFWPRDEEFTLMAMNWWQDHRAAISRVRIYEIDNGFMPSRTNLSSNGGQRQFGIWNEDSNGFLIPPDIVSSFTGEEPAAARWYKGLERLSKYTSYLGMNTIYYPVLRYNLGSTYPSEGLGRKIGWPANGYYDDYVKLWCLMAEKYNYGFHAYIIGWGFGDLIRMAVPSYPIDGFPLRDVKKRMQESLPDIIAGHDTIALMNNRNKVSSSGWRNTLGINPLHPVVRNAFDTWLDGFLNQYGDLPAFKGIDIQLSDRANVFTFPSKGSGYGDYVISLFERETGIKVPGKAPDPQRFRKRYTWLLKNSWEKWLEWRSDQVTRILRLIEQRVHEHRKDLDVDLGLYGFWNVQIEDIKKGEFSRFTSRDENTGIDLEKISNINDVRLLKRISPAFDRYKLTRKKKKNRIGFTSYRWAFEHPVLDRYADGAFFYHKYYEYRHRGEKRDLFSGFKRSGPLAGYIRYSGRHSLRPWVRQVANIDPVTLVFGGFGLTSAGREGLVKEFARNYIPLPPVSFENRFDNIQPLTYRELKKNEKNIFI